MEKPSCPFCDIPMVSAHSKMAEYYHLFVCDNCHAELKQVLVRLPEKKKKAHDEQEACPDCFTSELHCFSCDDPICEAHLRTFEKYSPYLTEELAKMLIDKYGNRIYCALCFQTIFQRFSRETGTQDRKKPQVFNLPSILMLLAAVFMIVFGYNRCPTAKVRDAHVEQSSEVK